MSSDDFDFLGRGGGESVSERSAWKRADAEDLRSTLEDAWRATGGDEAEDREKYRLPGDEDTSVRADAERAWFETEENAHERAMKARAQSKLDEVDTYARTNYGQSAADTFAQLDNLHAMAVHRPAEFAQRWQQILQDPAAYRATFQDARLTHAENAVNQFLSDRGFRGDSAMGRHIGEILTDRNFKWSGDFSKDLRAAYSKAMKAREAA